MRKILFILMICSFLSYGQHLEQKSYHIQRTEEAPIIDGKENDAAWEGLEVGTHFSCMTPDNGKLLAHNFRTEWKGAYDNKAVYFIIKMYDPAPDSLLKQLSERDDLEKTNTDQVGLWINPYNDGQTDFNFAVSAAGVQADAKYSTEGVDINWDMVWESEIAITEEGWIAEFKIPYAALRFPKSEVQTWGLNIGRQIRRTREWYTWSYLDMSKENLGNQSGELIGLKNIEPPLRLSFMPYLSTYTSHYEGETKQEFNGGMDLKYGINESFTLDMTLIPDFGQVGFDNQVLNLTPFEVQYDEKRPFFTEGTELLEKGGLFYSRRISDNLLNATKVTGRNQQNLGVGVLNAITGENSETADVLSNYNVFAIDQSFNQNSSVTFTNTNVQRHNNEGSEANVWGLKMSLQDKGSNYQFGWVVNQSQVQDEAEKSAGFAARFRVAKISGKFRYALFQDIESDTYNPNHLGFLYNNNEFTQGAELSYRIVQSTPLFAAYNSSIEYKHEQLHFPRKFVESEFFIRQIATFKNYLTWGFFSKIKPYEGNDYFEARNGLEQVFKRSKHAGFRSFISSDYRKAFALDAGIHTSRFGLYDGHTFGYRIAPRLRFNDKLFMSFVFSTEKKNNDAGYATSQDETSIFAIRDIEFFTNVLEAQYVMSNKMHAKIKFRHHWEQVENHSFHLLDNEGYLSPSDYQELEDVNFNSWNIDLSYSWWFAPGSELSIVWKNAILSQGEKLETYYTDNLEALLNNPQENSISLKLRYYLDYQYLKRNK